MPVMSGMGGGGGPPAGALYDDGKRNGGKNSGRKYELKYGGKGNGAE